MKETIFINLEPYEWRQSIRAEHGKRYNGRSLQMSARVQEDQDIEFLGTDEKLEGLTVHLRIMEGEPTTGDGKPLENGIGLFVLLWVRPVVELQLSRRAATRDSASESHKIT